MSTRFIFVLTVLSCMLLTIPALAAPGESISLQGYLTGDAGDAIDDDIILTISVYDSVSGGVVLHSAGVTVDVDEGFFTAVLDIPGLADIANDNEALWVGLAVDSDQEMEPRLQVTTTPWAAAASHAELAADADLLGGLEPADYRQVSEAIEWSELTGTPVVLGDTTCADGQFLQYSTGFSAWGCVDPSSSESDPVFATSAASGINSTDISLWNQSYGWGDHSTSGYITSESDALFAASDAAGIASTDITAWNTAAGYGDHSAAGYLTTESDPGFAASDAASITSTDITAWNTAAGYGDHSAAGYLTQDTLSALNCADGDTVRYDNSSSSWQCVGDAIVQVDDARITYAPSTFDCAAGNWCEAPADWGVNRFAINGRYTKCTDENDCSTNTLTLALNNNSHRAVLMSHLDWTNTRYFDVYLSVDAGSTYTFHKRVDTFKQDAINPGGHVSTIRTLASNLPLGVDVRVQIRATRGRLHFDGFKLSTQTLPETPTPWVRPDPQVYRYRQTDGADHNNWTQLSYVNFAFDKRYSNSRLKVTWTDSYRTISGTDDGGACGWDLRIDGSTCAPNPLLHVQHNTGSNPSADTHMSSTVVGVCEAISAGGHTITVWAKRRDGDEDCYRGHALSLASTGSTNNYGSMIMVEEIR